MELMPDGTTCTLFHAKNLSQDWMGRKKNFLHLQEISHILKNIRMTLQKS